MRTTDIEADQVLGGMLSILQSSKRSSKGKNHLAPATSETIIEDSIQALKAWVLVARMMGSAFVSHSKAGQKMLDVRAAASFHVRLRQLARCTSCMTLENTNIAVTVQVCMIMI
jgi:hypothetical protein